MRVDYITRNRKRDPDLLLYPTANVPSGTFIVISIRATDEGDVKHCYAVCMEWLYVTYVL